MTHLSEQAKWTAINIFLADWGLDMTADEVLDAVYLMTDDVVVWEPFEHYDSDWIVAQLLDAASAVQRAIDRASQRVEPGPEFVHHITSEATHSARDLYLALSRVTESASNYIEDGSWIDTLEGDVRDAKKQLKTHIQYRN